MPRYRLTLYPCAGQPRDVWFQAPNAERARGRFDAERSRPGIRAARLESAKGKHLAGCRTLGTVPAPQLTLGDRKR